MNVEVPRFSRRLRFDHRTKVFTRYGGFGRGNWGISKQVMNKYKQGWDMSVGFLLGLLFGLLFQEVVR